MEYSFDFDSETTLSIENKQKNIKYPAPLYFNTTDFNNIKEALKYIIDNQLCYAAGFFSSDDKSGYRKTDNFLGALYIFLDIDSPECTIDYATQKIKEHGYYAIILPSKNHNKEKNGVICERFRIILPLSKLLQKSADYKATCRKLSWELCNGKDDKKCHEVARFFYPSLPGTEPIFIRGIKQVNIVKGEEAIRFSENTDEVDFGRKNDIKDFRTQINQDKSISTLLENHFKSINLKYIISHFNESNQTFNLYRDEKDKKPGCFLYVNSNIICDNNGKNIPIYYSPSQLIQADETRKYNDEELRKKIFKSILNDLEKNKNKEYNIILTSEGLGKSSLVPNYKEIYGKDRIILLCKSYDQLKNKKEMFNKYFPNLKTEIIKGGEKFLRDYNISEGEWIYSFDPETGDDFINLRKSVENATIPYNIKRVALEEIAYNENIIERLIPIDIILMVEEKLKVEVLIKHRFRGANELIVWDEFHFDGWVKDRVIQPKDLRVKANIDRVFEQPTWNEKFLVKMLAEKNYDWRSYMKGQKIILTTESIVEFFFNRKFKDEEYNIIDERNIFFVPNVHVFPTEPTLLRKAHGNKEKTATSFRLNGFNTIGNGIQSKINNVTMKGQNYHDRFSSDEEIVLLLTQPSPEEIAPLMRNLFMSSEEATLTLMRDNLNQYIGRCNGFRNNLKVKSFTILIPNNLINDILLESRYICPIKRVTKDATKKTAMSMNVHPKVEKVLFTLGMHFKVRTVMNKKLYLSSMIEKVNYFIDNFDSLIHRYIKEKKNFWSFKLPKVSYRTKLKNIINSYRPDVLYSQLNLKENINDFARVSAKFDPVPV